MYTIRTLLPNFHHSYSSLRLKYRNTFSVIVSKCNCSYIVLLPEAPDESEKSNTLLKDDFLPNFEELTKENCFMGVGKKSLDYELGVWNLEKRILENEKQESSVILKELDILDETLGNVWNIGKTLYTVKNDEFNTQSYLKIHERARKARALKYQNRPIFETLKNIYNQKSSLNAEQKRVIQKYILECRLNGLELKSDEHKALQSTLRKLEGQKEKYKKNIEKATKLFSYKIIDKEVVKDLPQDLLEHMSTGPDPNSGPWVITHSPAVYERFLESCPDKELRWNAWNAYIMRASQHTKKEFSNVKLVEEIRDLRDRQAKALGFKHFADMSMETKMAGSVENVIDVITALFANANIKQTEEIDSVKLFAAENGFKGEFELSDLPFWRKTHLESIVNGGEHSLHTYFTFDFVWDQLLSLCSNLFGIHFEKAPEDSFTRWHPSVMLYNVLNHDGNIISSFYVDPFRRTGHKLEPSQGAAWVVAMKRKSQLNPRSLISIVYNFQSPISKDSPSLLTIKDVETMFEKFGSGLQYLLSMSSYGQVCGVTNVEWDAVGLCSNFMQNWLYEPSILERLGKHYQTGELLTKDHVKRIIQRRQHLAAYDLCQELFLAHFDIRLYSEQLHWTDILKEIWPTYSPFPLTKYNCVSCWFSPIMSDVWAAAYYSHVWSRALAADAFQAFQECEPREVTEVGKRFRETFLISGGSSHSAETFRQFRGRDPMPEALHSVLGIS